MTLPEFSIKRYVMAFMMSAALMLFGIIGYQQIGIDRLPDIDFPVISITTSVPGGEPGIIDSAVTREIIRRVNTVPGIDDIQSESVDGRSSIAVTFQLEKDIDVAFTEVQTKVNQAMGTLPTDAEVPLVEKVEANAMPVLWLSIRGDRTLQQLTEIARNTIRPQLEIISGVGDVMLSGGRNRRIRVEIDVDSLNAENMTVQDVIAAINEEHVTSAGGYLVSGPQEQVLQLDQEFHDTDELGSLIIGERSGRIVRLSDVSTIVDGLTDYRQLARYNGEVSVGLGVVKIAGTNTVEIINEIKQRLEDTIIPQLPPGVTVDVSSDESDFINSMIENLEMTLILAALLTALVMFVFLKSLRSTLIISVSVPISLLAVVAVMYFFGFTLNAMTMLAILLLIGVVIDDAIVVLENIHRHREEGETDPEKAAITGSNQVFFAVIASSLALTSIFGPVIFMEGIIGRFFESFAVVVVFGILASTFVALTLIPVLCARYLTIETNPGKVSRYLESAFTRVESAYQRLLRKALLKRGIVLGIAAVIVLPAGLLLGALPAEFAPTEDEGQFVVSYRTPIGSSINYTDTKMAEVEQVLAGEPTVESFFSAVGFGGAMGVSGGTVFVRLQHWSDRDEDQSVIIDRLQAQLDQLTGVRARATASGIFAGQQAEPLQFFVSGPELDTIADLSATIEQRLLADERIGTVDVDLNLEQPQLRLDLNREQLRLLGMSSVDVIDTVGIMVGGRDIARYHDDFGGGERFRIRMKADESQFQSLDDINRIFLRTEEDAMVRLDSVASVEETVGPGAISRFNLQYGARFFVNPVIPVGDAAQVVEALGEELLPPGYALTLMGEARELERTSSAIAFVFVLATLLVFMVLASQFNSFLQPGIVMLAMPLAMVGGLFGLWLTGQSLNIFSMIAMILLIGVVTKNSILLIDLTNQYRLKQGMTVDEALLAACPVRLRPVLMTSLTLILAMVPAAVGSGPGANGNSAMSTVIISGMLTATLLTLVVIPAAYSVLENRGRRARAGSGAAS